jgi:hypothetical protein
MTARRVPALDRPDLPATTKSTRRLTVDVPIAVHRAFRQLALDRDTDTSALLRGLIARALDEAGS